MLEEAIDAIEAIADRFGDGSIQNSGNTPAPGRTGAGTATSTVSGGAGGGSPSDRSDPPRDSRRDRDSNPDRDRDTTPDHDRPDYERSLQEENAVWTAVDTALTVIGHFFKGAGTKVLGPLMPAVQGSDAVAEGVPTVVDYHPNKWDRINQETGGYFESQGRGGSDGGSGGSGGSNSGQYDRWNP